MIDVDAFRGLRGDVCRRRAVFDDIGKSANAPRACRRQFFLRNSCLFPVSAANDSRKNHPNQRDDEDRPQVHGQNMTCSCRSGVFLRMPCHLLEKSSVFLNKLLFGTMSSTFFASAITAGRRPSPAMAQKNLPRQMTHAFPLPSHVMFQPARSVAETFRFSGPLSRSRLLCSSPRLRPVLFSSELSRHVKPLPCSRNMFQKQLFPA